MFNLRFQLIPKPHPYPTDRLTPYEAWGQLQLWISNDSSRELLLDTQWNLDALAEAYIEKAQHLCSETLPEVDVSESLAAALNHLTGRDFDDEAQEAQWYDTLYQFREIHSLPFWLEGASTPWITIGCNRGVGEISLAQDTDPFRVDEIKYESPFPYYKPGTWAYNFDMPEFQRHLHAELHTFLTHWLDTTPFEQGRTRAKQLLEQLNTL